MQNLHELSKILASDVELAVQKVNEASSDEMQFYSRTYLRAYASWIEGSLFMHKKLIAKTERNWYLELPAASQLYLLEVDWKIANSGEPREFSKKIRTQQNLKAFFFVSQQIFAGYKTDFENHGWGCVKEFYKLRDSMMHPSDSTSFNPSVDQINSCDDGRQWLLGEFRRVRDCMLDKNADKDKYW